MFKKTDLSSTISIRSLRNNALEKYESERKNFQEIEVISFPAYKILNGVSSETRDVCSCCIFIIYSKSNTTYFFGHFNSIEYILPSGPRNLLNDDFKEIMGYLKDSPLPVDTYEAILIGGEQRLFDAIAAYLSSQNIKITASYHDNYNQLALDDTLQTKSIIFNHTTHKVTIFSGVLPKQTLILDNAHLTFKDNFQEKKEELEKLTAECNKKELEKLMANYGNEVTDELTCNQASFKP
ncbi:Uncharacterised protein [Legionella beliardensis]|uniref:Uncharacterized protein n=1 Tax=Legionella beliardensis TaxID=91822 RepID=A0A378HZ94_9GAMM|nr:hypothetical protein [Legionella beliardensis]STX28258.1 Uncharacterised protein [Legionella beliardensis]